MSTRNVLILASMAAMLFAPSAFGIDPLPDALDSPFYIVGEKTDSGLGDLSPSYTAAEFRTKMAHYRVLGESLDSGLGALPVSYTAAEFQKQVIVATR